MKKFLLFWFYFVLSIVLAIYFSTRIITSQMGRGPVSTVNHLDITGDTQNLDIDAVTAAVGVQRGTAIRSVDIRQINNKILAVPGIKNASTRRLPNGNLIVKTEMHKPIAMYSDGLYFYPLSADGTKIETPMEQPSPNTIVIHGKLPKDLTNIINILSGLSEHIDYIDMVESRRWNIHTKSGITIYLPEENVANAVSKLNLLNQKHQILSRDLSVIDMRDDSRILVKTRK